MDTMGSRTLQITAWTDKDLGNDWTATITSPPGLAGIFGIGRTLHDARTALATNVAAITTIADQFDKIRVITVTRKTFRIADLARAKP